MMDREPVTRIRDLHTDARQSVADAVDRLERDGVLHRLSTASVAGGLSQTELQRALTAATNEEHMLETTLAVFVVELSEMHRDLISDEVDRRAGLIERFYYETSRSTGVVRTPRAQALESVLGDFKAGRL